MHYLDIIYHNTYNLKSLKIEDNSIYDEDLDVDNLILEVKPPGSLGYEHFYFANKKWKSITLNCATLKLCCTKQPCKFSDLPDGIYDMKYSINPNLSTLIELSHMRTSKIMSNYAKLTGLYFSNRHLYTRKQNDQILEELLLIKDTIDASVYAVEERLDNTLGIELYEEAAKKIKNINDGNFTRCCK